MRLVLSTFQWAMFILAGCVVAPLAIGQAYGMMPQELADFVQRTFFVLGIASLLQAFFGHRLPIMEGPLSCGGAGNRIRSALVHRRLYTHDENVRETPVFAWKSAAVGDPFLSRGYHVVFLPSRAGGLRQCFPVICPNDRHGIA
jgi:hypothetical protein